MCIARCVLDINFTLCECIESWEYCACRMQVGRFGIVKSVVLFWCARFTNVKCGKFARAYVYYINMCCVKWYVCCVLGGVSHVCVSRVYVFVHIGHATLGRVLCLLHVVHVVVLIVCCVYVKRSVNIKCDVC